jgi:hypothetical protein
MSFSRPMQRGPVAQVSNLLYRRLPVGGTQEMVEPAGWKPLEVCATVVLSDAPPAPSGGGKVLFFQAAKV